MITDYNKFLKENKIVDDLLDKISSKGIKSLTPNELEYLKKVSDPKKDVSDLEKKITREPNKVSIICTNFNIPDLEFTYKSQENRGDEILYYGTLMFNDVNYEGIIYCDEEGEFIWADFYSEDETDDKMDQMEGDLYADAEGLEHEIDHFFADELCPKLKNIHKIL